jgi:hypothetical protein
MDSRWILEYGEYQVPVSFSKSSVENISVSTFLDVNSYSGKRLYVDSGNRSEVYFEIAYTIGPFTEKTTPACFGECEDDLPEKNCSEFLIVYRSSEINKVTQEENCIMIEGDLRAVDAFIYKAFDTY